MAHHQEHGEHEHYYVPPQSKWPALGALALGFIVFGAANFAQQHGNHTIATGNGYGGTILLVGIAMILFMLVGWWRDVINESMGGLYSGQMDRSFRQGMMWFISSEVMFFFAFFLALFYTRMLVVPWLGGEGYKTATHELLWPNFQNIWPLVETPKPLAHKVEAMGPVGLPLINTILLVTSSITLTFAHHALKDNNHLKTFAWLFPTVLLGVVFLCLQGYEYYHAYHTGLTLSSGIYGTTFFMLTGFHGMHVTLGAIMLIVMTVRVGMGHFTGKHHFAFEAAAWYWHFVDVVWIILFVFVYCM